MGNVQQIRLAILDLVSNETGEFANSSSKARHVELLDWT